MNNIAGFFSDIASNLTLKAVITSIIAIATYLIGGDNLQVFLALITLVAIEYLMRVVSFIHNAPKGLRVHAAIEALEVFTFSTTVQMVTYGMLASAAHLTDSIVLGGHLFAEAVISFLAVSQLIRIIKSASGMGYSLPQNFIDWLENFQNSRLPQSSKK